MIDHKAEEVMNTSVVTFRPDTDIYDAIKTFLEHHFSGAPVVDDEHRVVGILSEKDCLRVLTGEAWDGLPEGHVGDYMTHPVASVKRDTSVADVVAKFLAEPYRRLPVLDDGGKLVGLISRRDVLRAINSMADNPYLYGTEERALDVEAEDAGGVHSAMRRALEL